MIWCYLLGGWRDVPKRRLVMDNASGPEDPQQSPEDPGCWSRSPYPRAPTPRPQDPDSDGCFLLLVMLVAIIVIMILTFWAIPQIARPVP